MKIANQLTEENSNKDEWQDVYVLFVASFVFNK